MAFDPETQAKFDRMNLDKSKVKPYVIPEMLPVNGAF